jgi:hypothetical protein
MMEASSFVEVLARRGTRGSTGARFRSLPDEKRARRAFGPIAASLWHPLGMPTLTPSGDGGSSSKQCSTRRPRQAAPRQGARARARTHKAGGGGGGGRPHRRLGLPLHLHGGLAEVFVLPPRRRRGTAASPARGGGTPPCGSRGVPSRSSPRRAASAGSRPSPGWGSASPSPRACGRASSPRR